VRIHLTSLIHVSSQVSLHLCSSNIGAPIVSARLQIVFYAARQASRQWTACMPHICFFMQISIQTERQKENNTLINIIYLPCLTCKLNSPSRQHVSKTKQNILVVTFGRCSILSSSFEFTRFGIVIFVECIIRLCAKLCGQSLSQSMILFATCLRLPVTVLTDRTHKRLETLQNIDDSRVDYTQPF
jgi:hypothetical protein